MVPAHPHRRRGALRATPATATPGDIRAALSSCAAAWGLSLDAFDVGAVGAADRLVVAGPSAIAALIEAFVGQRDRDWADQVVIVATPHAHRQLGALATALVNAAKSSTLLAAADSATATPGARAIASADADPADAGG